MSAEIGAADPVGDSSPVQPAQRRKLRLWPAVIVLLVMLGAMAVQMLLLPQLPPSLPVFMTFVFGPVVCCGLIGLWWLFLSRAPWSDRLLGLVGAVVLGVVAYVLSERSLHGMPFAVYVVPNAVIAISAVFLVLSIWGAQVATVRVATVAALIAGAFALGYWDLIRFDGMWGDFHSAKHWRWEKTAEETFLAELKPSAAPAKNAEPLGKVQWSEFRGPKRDGAVPGVVLDVDWKSRAPKEIWKHKVGPGWASFSAAGNRLFTQEQRGENEDVVCYDAKTGEERWVHESKARFDESMGGVGPRATPTLSGGMLYVQGAAGLLQCLDPLTGTLKWERDLIKEANRKKPPIWGYASSPLIVGDKVVAYSAGEEEDQKSSGLLLAFDLSTGEPKWNAVVGNSSYSSPQLARLAGHDLVLFWGKTGLTAVDAHSGKAAWNYDWLFEGYRVVQPLLLSETTLLLGTGMGNGTRRVEMTDDKGEVKFEDRWTSKDMKPDFNDYVAFNGYLYGLDHNILCCVDLATGVKKWKNGRYGNGQILLLPDAGQLLILSESGDLVVVRANPSKFEEVARQKVLEGKTWNHPVLVGNRVYVRNAEEMACFELPLAGQSSGDRTKTAPKEL
jgi:outer membrane protein assembly factor BamB